MQTAANGIVIVLLLLASAIHVAPFFSATVVERIACSRIARGIAFSSAAVVTGVDFFMLNVATRIWLYSADTWNGFILIPLILFAVLLLSLQSLEFADPRELERKELPECLR